MDVIIVFFIGFVKWGKYFEGHEHGFDKGWTGGRITTW